MHIVEADYEVVDGVLREVSARTGSRSYFPMASPAILGDFVRLRIGEEASLIKFARRWGLLGFERLMNRDTSSLESWAEGDPVAWIWAHVSGIRTAFRLWAYWRSGDEAALSEFFRGRRSSETQWRAISPLNDLLSDGKFVEARALIETHRASRPGKDAQEDVIIVSGDGPRITPVLYNVPKSSAARWGRAWGIVRDVINPNLPGVHPEIAPWATRSPSEPMIMHGWDSVMSVIYRHLFELMASGQVEECRECTTLFVRTDLRQRFCPPSPWSRESACAMRFHKREQRKRAPKAGPTQ